MEQTSSDPKLISFLIGLAIAALGWFGTAFGIGRKLTKIESGLSERISTTDIKVGFIEGRQNNNIESLKKLTSIENIILQVKDKQDAYDKTLARIDTFLLTRDGEPRFITYPAHDVMSKTCRDQIITEINHLVKDSTEMKDRWENHMIDVKNEMAKMTETLHKMAIHQATIAGRRHTDFAGEDK